VRPVACGAGSNAWVNVAGTCMQHAGCSDYYQVPALRSNTHQLGGYVAGDWAPGCHETIDICIFWSPGLAAAPGLCLFGALVPACGSGSSSRVHCCSMPVVEPALLCVPSNLLLFAHCASI
jgi:hypothetical protein